MYWHGGQFYLRENNGNKSSCPGARSRIRMIRATLAKTASVGCVAASFPLAEIGNEFPTHESETSPIRLVVDEPVIAFQCACRPGRNNFMNKSISLQGIRSPLINNSAGLRRIFSSEFNVANRLLT